MTGSGCSQAAPGTSSTCARWPPASGVSTATVYSLVERGELAHIRVLNAIRVAPAEVTRFENRPAETSRRRRKPGVVATCSCGTAYTGRTWAKLRWVGKQPQGPDDPPIELRNCPCGSSIGAEVPR